MAKQSFKRYISKLFQVAGVRVETNFANMQDNDFVVISRNLSGKTSSRQTVGDQQFYVRWDDFVAFLQGATTDKFINQATLVGNTLNFGYNNGDPGLAVLLDPLGLVTGMSFSDPILSIQRTGGLPDLTVDISNILDGAIVSASLVGTAIRYVFGNGGTFDVELSSLQDGVVTGGSLSGTDLILTRSLGGDVAGIDLSPLQDGVVTGGTVVSGQFLRLSRSLGGDVPDIDLSSATNAGVVLTFNNTFNRAQLDAMSSSNRAAFFGGEIGNSFHVISYAVELITGTTVYANDINFTLSYGTVSTGDTIASLNGWSFNNDVWSQTSNTGNIFLRKSGGRLLNIHHTTNLVGDPGDYTVKVTILYASIP